jgi:hypothetical protein
MLELVHGELLIETRITYIVESNVRLFSIIAFLHARAILLSPSIKLLGCTLQN